jgi:hypothetical protein
LKDLGATVFYEKGLADDAEGYMNAFDWSLVSLSL